MQTSFAQTSSFCAFRPARQVSARQRCVVAQASISKHTFKHAAAAAGAALMIMSPLAGPALARPSDFIQSKPGFNSTEATNEDKFPYNPSVSGNQARSDTKDQKSTQGTPQGFSNNKGLGDKNITNDKPLPDPIDTAPNPDKTGRALF